MQAITKLFQFSLVRFLLVGGVGLSLNVCLVYTLRDYIGLVPSRMVSYVAAFTVTWFLNRWFTFHSNDPKKMRQWSRYASIYVGTGVLHIASFAFLVNQFVFLNRNPIWAILIAAALIAFINFSLSRRFAFSKA